MTDCMAIVYSPALTTLLLLNYMYHYFQPSAKEQGYNLGWCSTCMYVTALDLEASPH